MKTQRIIKFRGKVVDGGDYFERGEWVYGYYVYEGRQANIYTKIEVESGGVGSGLAEYRVLVEFKSVSQFTGLKDRNGKEIYEKDIIAPYIGEHDGNDVVGQDEEFEVKWENCGFNIEEDETYLLLGNVFESKHLLKEDSIEAKKEV